MINLAVVIPVYNEELNIKEVLDDWINQLEQINSYQLILINDGSKDKSLKILENYKKHSKNILIIDKKNEGHGKAIIDGYKKALELNAQYIFQCDSDNQIEAKEMIPYIDKL